MNLTGTHHERVQHCPLGVDSFTTHHLPLNEAPEAYKSFQERSDRMVKVVFTP